MSTFSLSSSSSSEPASKLLSLDLFKSSGLTNSGIAVLVCSSTLRLFCSGSIDKISGRFLSSLSEEEEEEEEGDFVLLFDKFKALLKSLSATGLSFPFPSLSGICLGSSAAFGF